MAIKLEIDLEQAGLLLDALETHLNVMDAMGDPTTISDRGICTQLMYSIGAEVEAEQAA